MKAEIYRAMLYKTGSIEMGFSDCCIKKYSDAQSAVKYQTILFWTTFFLMLLQLGLTVVSGSIDTAFYASMPKENLEA
jgi:hypothetical protein